jgi:ATP-dependent Clp protease ATP-binding subunit ClpX
MTGPTGTGKTFMLSMLAQCLNVPFVRIDCSSLTAPGYQGADILDFLKDLGGVAGAVIMLDELDKLALKGSDSFNAYAMSAQAQLLDLLEGRYSGDAKEGNKHYSFYPATWLVVCAGSFQSSVKAERELNSTKHGMGFHGTKAPEPPQDPRSILRESGLMPELIGRIVRVIETKRLTKEQIIELMLRKDDSSYSKYRKVYQQLRLNIKEIEEIADKVLKSPSGLRELDSLIFNEICNHMASFKSWDNNTNRSGK